VDILALPPARPVPAFRLGWIRWARDIPALFLEPIRWARDILAVHPVPIRWVLDILVPHPARDYLLEARAIRQERDRWEKEHPDTQRHPEHLATEVLATEVLPEQVIPQEQVRWVKGARLAHPVSDPVELPALALVECRADMVQGLQELMDQVVVAPRRPVVLTELRKSLSEKVAKAMR